MNYVSTRGGVREASFSSALLSGYACDGGLFVPRELPPRVTATELRSMARLTFPQLALRVLQWFIDDTEICESDLACIVHAACRTFDCGADSVIPVKCVSVQAGEERKDVHVVELFHGPTLSFKDVGQQIMCRLLAHFAKKERKRVTVVCNTTGDTGPAAIQGVLGSRSRNLRVIVCYPKGQISRLQELQLTTAISPPAVQVVAYEGAGDDMDAPIKRLINDPLRRVCGVMKQTYGLTGVNSINIGRIVAQVVHFFWAYLRCVSKVEEVGVRKITVAIPTGAMGNVSAGLLAQLMGLPIEKFVCGVNENDIVDRALRTGKFVRADSMIRTVSEAINCQVPYNFERLLYYSLNSCSKRTAQCMQLLDAHQAYELPPDAHAWLQQRITSAVVSDIETLSVIRRMWNDCRYLCDPHTAVGVEAALKTGVLSSSRSGVVACLATAHPCKFEAAIRAANIAPRFWEDHVMSESLPVTAAHVLSAHETQPVLFEADKAPHATLTTSQAIWQIRLRNLISTGSAGGAVLTAKL